MGFKFLTAVVLFWIANLLTWSRLILPPLLVFYFLPPHLYPLASLIVYLAFVATDALDGALARMSFETRFGAFMDPLADKVLLWSYAVYVAPYGGKQLIVTFAVLFILDIASTIERVLSYKRSEKEVKANWSGKLKMTFQFLAVAIFLAIPILRPESVRSAVEFWSVPPAAIGWIFLLVAAWYSAKSLFSKLEQWKN